MGVREREHAAELAQLTLREITELEQARLLQQAAEARAAATVTDATHDALIAEQRLVIAARPKDVRCVPRTRP